MFSVLTQLLGLLFGNVETVAPSTFPTCIILLVPGIVEQGYCDETGDVVTVYDKNMNPLYMVAYLRRVVDGKLVVVQYYFYFGQPVE